MCTCIIYPFCIIVDLFEALLLHNILSIILHFFFTIAIKRIARMSTCVYFLFTGITCCSRKFVVFLGGGVIVFTLRNKIHEFVNCEMILGQFFLCIVLCMLNIIGNFL